MNSSCSSDETKISKQLNPGTADSNHGVSTARKSLEQFSSQSSVRRTRASLPEIKTCTRRKTGYLRNKSTSTIKPKLHRSKTEDLYDTGDFKRQIFEHLKLKSQADLNGNLFIQENSAEDAVLTHSNSFDLILEKNYKSELADTDLDTEYNSDFHKPFFSNWKISGYNNEKVILSRLSDMSETQVVTPEFVQYIKERDTAVEEAKQAQSELRETQCKLYDSMLLIEDLEKKLKDVESTKTKGHKTTSKRATTAKKKSTATPSPRGSAPSTKDPGKESTSGGRKNLASSAIAVDSKLYHPPVAGLENVANSREYYWKLAEKFQTISMHQVLDAEKKFIEADTDNSGYIEKGELDKVLSDNVGLFTPDQLDAIFKEIDLDNSDTLDFYEVLFVLNKLYTRRRTNLPQSVQQNYSKTCNIQ